MFLYRDALKKMCFQQTRREEESGVTLRLTTSNGDFILWFGGRAEGGRVELSHSSFQLTQAHIRSRLFTSGWACSCLCMDRWVAIFGTQCDVGGRKARKTSLFIFVQNCINSLIQWYCDKLMFTCIFFDQVPPKLLCFWLFTNRQLQRGGFYGFHTSRGQRSVLTAVGGGTTVAER